MVATEGTGSGSPARGRTVNDTQRQLRAILMTWDPIGVSDIAEAADEYDCMLGPLLQMLTDGAGPAIIERWLADELQSHFGLSSEPSREARLAADLLAWWAQRWHDVDRSTAADRARSTIGVAALQGALARLATDEQPPEELPHLAALALADGEVDSSTLRELAGLSAHQVRESRELFLAAMAELNIQAPATDR